ncbi:hypothetical protein JZ751_027008 [Albula glossodonta]|uniref:Uncharacterized protein n=1 Tax=Albula glossodonta TaxID=121402 RepID=A0A8T2MXI4_9TELE|nr:hypothetical protein JZ751_027008 [Albula glossodonta]
MKVHDAISRILTSGSAMRRHASPRLGNHRDRLDSGTKGAINRSCLIRRTLLSPGSLNLQRQPRVLRWRQTALTEKVGSLTEL